MSDKAPVWARREIRRWLVWAAAVAASFAWLESRGLESREDDDPTLTGVVSRYVPGWLWFAALGGLKGWLDYHFSQAYESWHEPETYDLPR